LKWRLAVFTALAILTLAYRGMAVYTRYLSPDTATRATFAATYQDGAMVVTTTDSVCRWPDDQKHLCNLDTHPGDRLVEIHDCDGSGGAVTGLFRYGALLKPIGPEDAWTIVVDRPLVEGGFRRVSIELPPAVPIVWTLNQTLVNVGFDIVLPLLAMAVGLFVGFMRPKNNQAFLVALVFLGYSAAFFPNVAQFPPVWREIALLLRTAALTFSPYLILLFFLRFPRPSPIDRRVPWLSRALLPVTIAVFAIELTNQFTLHLSFAANYGFIETLGPVGLTQNVRGIFFSVYWVGAIALSLTSITLNAIGAENRFERRRMILVLASAAAGLIPPLLVNAPFYGPDGPPAWLVWSSMVAIAFFPAIFVYAVVRHQVFGIRLIFRRGLQYALVSRGFLIVEGIVLFLVLYFVAEPLVNRLIPGSAQSVASVGVAAITLGLILALWRINRRVLPLIDRRFFRDAYNTQRILTDLGRAVRQLASRPDRLIEKVTDEIVAAVHPDQIAIFLANQSWLYLMPLRDFAQVSLAPDRDNPTGIDFEVFVHRVVGPAPSGRRRNGHPAAPLYSKSSLPDLLREALTREPEALDLYPAPNPHSPPASLSEFADCDACLRFNTRLIVPLATAGKMLGFIVLGEKLSEEPYSGEDKELLLAVAEQVATALDYSLLIGQVAQQEKLEQEIRIAQDVQKRLLPQERPALRTLRYTGQVHAALRVGGDFYDFFRLGPDHLGIAVADIAGKGLSAALLTATLQALVRSHAPLHASDLGSLAVKVNQHLVESTDDSRFATLFFGVYDDTKRRLRFLNAGHNPPILVRTTGEGEVRRLDPGGMVLGFFPDTRYREQAIDLIPGDVLLVFSDGVVEAMNEHGEEFGDGRLVEVLRKHDGLPEGELLQQVLEEVGNFLGPVSPQDDITLIVARVV
jgi:sigma-B regulation protein RsbU (phosphoserine phosphatase)